jgi:hypothetical protein
MDPTDYVQPENGSRIEPVEHKSFQIKTGRCPEAQQSYYTIITNVYISLESMV